VGTIPLILVIVLSIWSRASLGSFHVHGSPIELVCSLLGRVWWLLFLVGIVRHRPLFLEDRQLPPKWSGVLVPIHALAVLAVVLHMALWLMLDSVLWHCLGLTPSREIRDAQPVAPPEQR